MQVLDENDIPPQWAKPEWIFEVKEEQPPNTALANLQVLDPDEKNEFIYRVSK